MSVNPLDVIEAARLLVRDGVTVHRLDAHECAVCNAYCPTHDAHHETGCSFIALKKAIERLDDDGGPPQ